MLLTSTIKHPKVEGVITMGERVKMTDPVKLTLPYERFRNICLVEKEVWKEIFFPREVTSGPITATMQDRYDVEIKDPHIDERSMRPSRWAAWRWAWQFTRVGPTFYSSKDHD